MVWAIAIQPGQQNERMTPPKFASMSSPGRIVLEQW